MPPRKLPRKGGGCTSTTILLAFSALVTLTWLGWLLSGGLAPAPKTAHLSGKLSAVRSSQPATESLHSILRSEPRDSPSAPSLLPVPRLAPVPRPAQKPAPRPAVRPAPPPPSLPKSLLSRGASRRSKVSCGGHHAATCAECLQGHDSGWCHGDCMWIDGSCQDIPEPEGGTPLHPAYVDLIREYPFQPVRTENGNLVNVILVRSPFRSSHQRQLYDQYKDEILFLGISSFEDYPLPPPNPFSSKFPADEYVGLFPGFLQMFRDASVFAPQTKTILMSQSDFSLPDPGRPAQKKYDFVFSGTDQDIWNDCVGWSSYAKNWTWVVESLEVMCGEFGLTGVLVATKDKQGRKACAIPKSCEGKILQTSYLDQGEFFNYVKQSRFAYVPQIHDASPRAAAQALALDTPVFMNWYIMGGWKYVNDKTGEFFHDMTDFREQLSKVLQNSKAGMYSPRKYMTENYGDRITGARLKAWVDKDFSDRVQLPTGVQILLPSGA